MTRPQQPRRVTLSPDCVYFKPAGVPVASLQQVVLTVDELEAMRLADLAGLYQTEAAEQMGVSRRTFGRILDSAHKKTAQALTGGLALRIEGGVVELAEKRTFACKACQHSWHLAFGTGRPARCPSCRGESFHRVRSKSGPHP